MVLGFVGDPQFATGTSGWTPSSGITLARSTAPGAVLIPGNYKWGSLTAGGQITWSGGGTIAYAGTDARIVMNDLIPGNWYFVQSYLIFPLTTSPRLQLYTTTSYGSFAGSVCQPPNVNTSIRMVTLRFRAGAVQETLRYINYDPAPNGSSTIINGLFIVPHILDPKMDKSIDGWDIEADVTMQVTPGADLGLTTQGLTPKDSSGTFYTQAYFRPRANHNQFTRAATFTKDDCIVGTTYQVLVRTNYMAGGIQGIPFILSVDNTQIAWASDKVTNDWVVLWGTFTATSTTHVIKLANAINVTSSNLGIFAGMDIQVVPNSMGTPLGTLAGPSYPAKINQTLYPCQPGYDDATVPQLVRQFQYMKDVGITELVMEQIINMSERRAYYDTGLKTAKTVLEPVSNTNVTLPVVPVYNDLVDRIIEAKTIVGGIDLWWGIGRYWPWEYTPTVGSGVTSTVDTSVSWTSASWTADSWTNPPNEPGHGSSAEALAANKYIVSEIVAKYGAHIKGWYLPLEIESYGATWQPNHPWFRTLFYELTKMCLAAKSGIPVMVSPFYQDLVPYGTANEYDQKKEYAKALVYSYLPAAKLAKANGATKFILAQQDGLGDVDRTIDGSERIYHAIYNAMQISDAPADKLIELWHNLDLYDVYYNGGNPMDSTKLQDMMNRTNLLPSRTSFSFASQLSPQKPGRSKYWSAYRQYATGKRASIGAPFMVLENKL